MSAGGGRTTTASLEDLKEKYGLTYHTQRLNAAADLLEGARVLEVGGALPREVVVGYYGARSWTAVDDISAYAQAAQGSGWRAPDLRRLDAEAVPAQDGENAVYDGDAGDLPESFADAFDVVFSLATFEHVIGLERLLQKTVMALRSGGLLLTQVGPIWTGWRGHHIFPGYFAPDEDKTADMLDRMVPWQHLLMSPQGMREWLAGRYGDEFAGTAAAAIYESERLNRLPLDEYRRMFAEAGFETLHFEPNGESPPAAWADALTPRLPAGAEVDCFWAVLRAGNERAPR